MAIIPYKKHGKELFRVYVQALGKKDCSIRVQKNKFGIGTWKDAMKEEKKLLKLVNDELNRREGKGITWFDLVEKWEVAARYGQLGDIYKSPSLLKSHIQRLYKYTKPWFKLAASDLSKGDGRIVLNNAKELGASPSLLKKLKSSINVVFKWGMEEKLILGVHSSPTEGLVIKNKEEKLPMILTLEEVKLLLQKSKELQHPWYPIWAFAFFTGMRSGELLALQWKDRHNRYGAVGMEFSPYESELLYFKFHVLSDVTSYKFKEANSDSFTSHNYSLDSTVKLSVRQKIKILFKQTNRKFYNAEDERKDSLNIYSLYWQWKYSPNLSHKIHITQKNQSSNRDIGNFNNFIGELSFTVRAIP